MKKGFSKILSVFLVVIMLISSAPLSGFMETDWSDFRIALPKINLEKVIDSVGEAFGSKASALEAEGKCGQNAYYTFDEATGTVTITGFGSTYNYYSLSSPFFRNYAIKRVVVSDNITSIGDYLFYFCDELTSVSLTDTILEIGRYAFGTCHKLNTINMPLALDKIDERAFSDCISLTNVIFPDGLKTIEPYAFSFCGLASVIFPDSLESIGEGAFEGGKFNEIFIPASVRKIENSPFNYCDNLVEIHVDENNPYYDSRENCNAIIDSQENKIISACRNTSFPSSVNAIGVYAFLGCIGLTNIDIPDSITSIGFGAFCNCYDLVSFTIPNSITSISDSMFAGCISLTNVIISDNIMHIGDGAFKYCYNLKRVALGDGVTSIGMYAFSECSNLERIDFGTNIEKIDGDAFIWCNNLKIVNITNLKGWCEAEIPSSTALPTTYSGDLYLNNKLIEDLIIPEGTEKINFSFYNCKSIKSVYIPGSVKTVNSSFYGCSNLSKVTICEGVENIWKAFVATALTEVELPDSVASLYGAFTSCVKLKHVKLPKGLKIISSDAFQWCSSLTDIVIPSGVMEIKEEAFSGSGLQTITIPLSVKGIYTNSFRGCGNLKNVFYEGTKSDWKKIGIEYGNDPLQHAKIHYLSSGDKVNRIYQTNIEPYIRGIENTNFNKTFAYNGSDETGNHNQVDVNFNAKWFDTNLYSNKKYNQELCEFAADFSMMGYCYDEDDIVNYLAAAGFEPLSVNMNADRNGVNYFIAARTINVDGKPKQLVMTGTIGSYKDQWFSNFDPYGKENADNTNDYNSSNSYHTHTGFADARDSVYEELKYIMDTPELYGIDKENAILLFTGHSRGAATANLLAAKVIDDEEGWVEPENIYAYAFATPRSTQNPDRSSAKYNFIHNIVNPEDFVTKVMLDSWKYGRYGQTYTLPSITNTNNREYRTILNNVNYYHKLHSNGKDYIPYSLGEKTTYKIIKKMSDSVPDVDSFYSGYKRYFHPESKRLSSQTPFEFFKLTLINFVSGRNEAYGIMSMLYSLNVLNDSLYRDVISYFMNFGISLDKLKLDDIDEKYEEYSSKISLNLDFINAHEMATYCSFIEAASTGAFDVTAERKTECGSVNCPVDIEIIENATGEVVARIVNNVIDEEIAAKDNAVVVSVDGDEKEYWLPSDGDYTVKLIGNDKGTMDYSVSVVDGDGNVTGRKNYFDVQLEKGTSMTSVSDTETDFESLKLRDADNKIIEPDEVITESEAITYTVEAEAEGSGVVSGYGEVFSGDYTTLTATAQCSEFIGFFDEEDNLISDKTVYRFRTDSDIKIVAKFTEGNHTLERAGVTADCTTAGYVADVCTNCGYTNYLSQTPETGHSLIYHDEKANTCTESGRVAYTTCSRCDYTTYAEIPALGHNYTAQPELSNVVDNGDGTHTATCAICKITETAQEHTYELKNHTDGTCTENAANEYICTVCENTKSEEVENSKQHTETVIEGKAPTCTEPGLSDGVKCSVCGEIISAQVEIPATGHKGTVEKFGKPATCTEDATVLLYCECGEFVEEVTVPDSSQGHMWEKKNAKEVTCTEDGKEADTVCGVCGEIFAEGKIIPTSGHTSDKGTVTKKATCTTAGTKTFKCTVCGETVKTSTIKATGHTETILKARAATEKKSGLTEGKKCSACGKVLVAQKMTLAQVTDLKASTVKKDSIKLTWSKIDGAKYYKVEKYDSANKKWVAVKTVDTNSYTVSKLTAGTKYQFRVTALDSTKKISGKVSAALKTGTLTAAPSVTVKSSKSKTAVASWKKVTGASKYIVYKSTDGKKWTKVTTTTKLTYTLTKLTGGKKIYVKVVAVNAYGKESAASKVANTTVKK